MSTRAQVRFATREDGVSFSEHPEKIHAQFYVHSDGYPEGLGLDIAECFTNYGKILLTHLGITYRSSKHFVYGNWRQELQPIMIDQFDEIYNKVKQW